MGRYQNASRSGHHPLHRVDGQSLARHCWCSKGAAAAGPCASQVRAPRAGDATFAKAYDGRLGDRTWRVINNADIVTRVPPRALGYQHVGRAIHFDAAGRPRIESGSWNHFLDTLSGPIKDLVVWGAEGLADHSMGKYLSLVLAADSSSKHN